MMKTLRNIVICAVLAVVFTLAIAIGSYAESHVKMDATVTKVDHEIITVVDKTGDEWQFFGNGFEVGQKVTCTVYTPNTENMKNAEIVNVK